jgi:hypothetical protein
VFVPVGFEPPTSLTTGEFHLEPLGPQHNQADHAAWMSSIDHIRSTPGYPDGKWPPVSGMTLEENLADRPPPRRGLHAARRLHRPSSTRPAADRLASVSGRPGAGSGYGARSWSRGFCSRGVPHAWLYVAKRLAPTP